MSFISAMAEWATKQKEVVLKAVQDAAPVGGAKQLDLFGGAGEKQTLKTSLHARAIGRVGVARIEIRSPLRYSVIVKEGHAIIYPVNAQILHWVNENGEDVFAPYSSAKPPNPYPQRGWEKVKSGVMADLQHRMTVEGVKTLHHSIKLGGLI